MCQDMNEILFNLNLFSQSPKKKLKRQVSTSTTESSIDQNTDDERFLDDGNSANDSDFIDDESVDDQYSSASSVSVCNRSECIKLIFVPNEIVDG